MKSFPLRSLPGRAERAHYCCESGALPGGDRGRPDRREPWDRAPGEWEGPALLRRLCPRHQGEGWDPHCFARRVLGPRQRARAPHRRRRLQGQPVDSTGTGRLPGPVQVNARERLPGRRHIRGGGAPQGGTCSDLGASAKRRQSSTSRRPIASTSCSRR